MTFSIFVITIPQVGHLNALLGILNELSKQNCKVTVYSTKRFQESIENCNVLFRPFVNMASDTLEVKDVSLWELIPFLTKQMLNIFDSNCYPILRDIIIDGPDLILFDCMAPYAKWIANFYYLNQTNLPLLSNLLNMNVTEIRPLPRLATYTTSFLSLDGVYPNEHETEIKYRCSPQGRLNAERENAIVKIQTKALSDKYGFNLEEYMYEQHNPNYLNIVFTFEQLQPRSKFYDKKTTKFVGSCINDSLRLNGSTEVTNETDVLLESIGSRRLVFISFGTTFTHKLEVYKKVIGAFSTYSLASEDLFIIIVTGATMYGQIMELIEKHELQLSDNIRLYKSIEQLKILRKSALFLTHCGFNSISEAVHYGVPMICLPISAEQPINSFYIANDLKLGIELNAEKLTIDDVVTSVLTLLNDKTYKERCLKYSELSRKLYGPLNAANEIINYIKSGSYFKAPKYL